MFTPVSNLLDCTPSTPIPVPRLAFITLEWGVTTLSSSPVLCALPTHALPHPPIPTRPTTPPHPTNTSVCDTTIPTMTDTTYEPADPDARAWDDVGFDVVADADASAAEAAAEAGLAAVKVS